MEGRDGGRDAEGGGGDRTLYFIMIALLLLDASRRLNLLLGAPPLLSEILQYSRSPHE